MPRISVVLTTYNDDLRLALALSAYAGLAFRDFEVIVSNDGGSRPGNRDATRELVLSFASKLDVRYTYVEPESTVFRLAQARNQAIRIARGRQLIITDGDCIPSPDLLALFDQEYRETRILVGTRRRIAEQVVPELTLRHFPHLESIAYSIDRRLTFPPFLNTFLQMRDAVPPNSWRLCWGCLFSAPTQKVKDIGGFDERFRDWGREDEDLVERLVKGTGCVFYAMPEAVVYHLDHPARNEDTPTRQLLEEIRQNWTVVRNGGPLV